MSIEYSPFIFPAVRTLSLLVPYFAALSIRLAPDHHLVLNNEP